MNLSNFNFGLTAFWCGIAGNELVVSAVPLTPIVSAVVLSVGKNTPFLMITLEPC
jgi:hypothetical protein